MTKEYSYRPSLLFAGAWLAQVIAIASLIWGICDFGFINLLIIFALAAWPFYYAILELRSYFLLGSNAKIVVTEDYIEIPQEKLLSVRLPYKEITWVLELNDDRTSAIEIARDKEIYRMKKRWLDSNHYSEIKRVLVSACPSERVTFLPVPSVT